MRNKPLPVALALALSLVLVVGANAQTATKIVGTITAISGHTITVKPDQGPPLTLTVSDTARILRAEPGATKMSSAQPMPFSDLADGDRVLALVKNNTAVIVVAMKHADIAERQLAEAAAWKNGAGGLVKTVDAAAGIVTIASGPRTVTIHITPKTAIRQYSADSALFAEAKPSTLAQIHPGDQLRVRGTKSADGAAITADGIVFGSFRNIAGTIVSIHPADQTVTVNDFLSRKPVVLHITAESQLHKLPPEMAQAVAARLKNSVGARNPGGKPPAQAPPQSAPDGGSPGQAGSGRGGDLSQMLEQSPSATLSDLHKGDAVIIVASQGTPASANAITLLAGVEPILRAFPSGNQSVFSASWNLSGGGAGAAAGAGAGGGGAP